MRFVIIFVLSRKTLRMTGVGVLPTRVAQSLLTMLETQKRYKKLFYRRGQKSQSRLPFWMNQS